MPPVPAGALSTTSVRVSGRPLSSTTTNGLPVAAIASISSCCRPGRSRVERVAASPLISRGLADGGTTWSAAFAAATASAKPASDGQSSAGSSAGGSSLLSAQPWAYVVVPDDAAVMPVSTLTTSASSPRPHQGPSRSCWLSASGPITAVFLARRRAAASGPRSAASTIERAGSGAGRLAVGRGEEAGGADGLGLVDVRALEQAGAELDAQDPPYGVVEAPSW